MRRGLLLCIGAGIAAASLVAVPFERLAPSGIDLITLRLLAVIQPTVVFLATVALGCWLAPKVGFGTPLIDAWRDAGDVRAAARRQLVAAVPIGVAVAALLILYASTAGRIIADGMAPSPAAGFAAPLVAKLLYGGIGEELLLRWG